MLQAIRDKSKGILGAVIVILLGIPFAFFGIQNYFSGQVDDTVARINDIEISLDQFQDEFNRERSRMRARFGDALDASYFNQPMIRRQILDNMIQKEILSQAVTRAGMEVSAERLREAIIAVDDFKVDGQFDPTVYTNLLKQNGMTPKMYEGRVRRDLLLNQLPVAVGETSLVLSGEVATAARLQNQTRTFDYLVLKPADFSDQVQISEEEIQQYYDENASSYLEPEKVTVEYLELEAAMLTPDSEPDEELLRQRYEEQMARFILPERRLTSHILISVPANADAENLIAARTRAQALTDQARAGESFEDLARENSEDSGSATLGGDLSWVERDAMVTAFEDALFAMAVDDISDPVNTSYGFHVIWLRDLEESRGKTFDEARFELAQEFRENEAERLFLEQQNRLFDLTYEDQGTLEPAAEELGLEVRTEGPFGRIGGEGIAADPAVIAAAFSDLQLRERINSDPITLGPNHVAFLRVVDHIEATPKALESVSEEIRAQLVTEKAHELAKESATRLHQRLTAGEELADLALESELTVTSALDIRRNGPGHDNSLVSEVFRLPRPAETPTRQWVEYGTDGIAVVFLATVTDPDQSQFTVAQSEALKSRMNQSYSQAEVVGMGDLLRGLSEVVVSEDKIQQRTTIQ